MVPKKGVPKMTPKMDPQQIEILYLEGSMVHILAPPGGMRGGPGEVRRGKPLRVLQGFYARILKLRISRLRILRLSRIWKELNFQV